MKKILTLALSAVFAVSVPSTSALALNLNQVIGDGNTQIQVGGHLVDGDYVDGNVVGGDYVGGNFVGGDQIGGDFVGGDQVDGNNLEVNGDNNTTVGGDNINVGDNNTFVFMDLQGYEWAQEAINSFVNRGVVEGMGNNMFAPGEAVSREQFAKMLALTFFADEKYPDTPSFVDVIPERWSYGFIEGVKDYLTGYISPISNKMAFYPDETATREDIAVSLVRIMGLTDADARNGAYAFDKFPDADLISPSLVKYVSIAAEMGLIRGYSDGYFRPTQGITRAECVVLLNRVLKQAVVSATSEIVLDAVLNQTNNNSSVLITIEVDSGAKVTVNDQPVTLSPTDDYSRMYGVYKYDFTAEGLMDFLVVATKGEKVSESFLTAAYYVDSPNLDISSCPPSTTERTVSISGSVGDPSNKVTINNENCYVDSFGNWSKTVALEPGTNEFIISATNSQGKTTSYERSVKFLVDAPSINIESSSIAYSNTYALSGTVSGSVYDNVSLTVNGKSVSLSNGRFNCYATLSAQFTEFRLVATTASGQRETATFQVENRAYKNVVEEDDYDYDETETNAAKYSVPKLTVNKGTSTVRTNYISVSGTAVDSVNKVTDVSVNGKSVSSQNGGWSTIVDLTEGVNDITIVATNAAGYTAKETIRITYTPPKERQKRPGRNNNKDNGTVAPTEPTEPTETPDPVQTPEPAETPDPTQTPDPTVSDTQPDQTPDTPEVEPTE